MKKTKEELKELAKSESRHYDSGVERNAFLEGVSFVLRQEYSDQEKQEWVKCSDRLPEIGQVVDIWKHDKELSKFYRVTNFTFEKNIVINFTHWMPLPQKPEV